jgi:hypothetical protein
MWGYYLRKSSHLVGVITASLLLVACTASAKAQPAKAQPAKAQPAKAQPARAQPAAAKKDPLTSSCQRPKLVSTSRLSPWQNAGYYVSNDMWNVDGYNVRQTLSACSYRNWYVTATMTNNTPRNVVKTYPNVYRTFPAVQVRKYHAITAAYSHGSTGGGTYEDAFDIWFNGVAQSWATEIMIWTDTHSQVPRGSVAGHVTLAGKQYTVWKDGNVITFVAAKNSSAAILNLLGFFSYVIGKKWMTNQAELRQVSYGVELVSTNGVPKTFAITNFWVTAT